MGDDDADDDGMVSMTDGGGAMVMTVSIGVGWRDDERW